MLTFQVGYAKSGRSHCKKCRDAIDDGCVRMGVTSDYSGMKQVSWYHVDCLLQISLARSCTPAATSGFRDLQPSDQDLFIRKFASLEDDEDELELGNLHKRVKPAVEVPDCTEAQPDVKDDVKDVKDVKPLISAKAQSYLDRLVAKAEEQKFADLPRPSRRRRRLAKPADWQGYTAAQYAAFKKACEALGPKSTEELKEMCKRNDQKVSGSKLDLIERVADGQVLGKIPRCKTCSKAVLRFDPRSGNYTCPGFMAHSQYTSCGKEFPAADVVRTKWLD